MDSTSTQDRVLPFEERYRADVIALWEKCGLTRPWNDPDKDIDRKQTDENGAFFVLLRGDRLIGSVMAGYDGHRGSINYLSVDPECQTAGLGKMLMSRCEAFLVAKGCPKINLMVRQDNDKVLRFYEQLGYAEESAVSLGKRLIPDI
ncbi:GNAT family acetyltransferase [Labrenzia sp. PO1]|jgi:ribosomal protein S18 acetylase RimI-like enzyme|uniref:GNAT family acetyltransferase n=1 Tax=unclassified Labrenzia TaxID=2648686 RepID=UPI001448812A|nr:MULTISPECIES: GNAT family acetyltransferase [unclassified Labrenzia]MBO9462895.1 GNAT family acetyltransferase [Labrenzia sp. R5_0]MCR9283015.1 GNAT family acetyltransferase [Paracoccaceae bacterium]NKI59798.1 GNAT family acetyltransferase [Labrenzia sp. PO1]